MPGPGQWRWSLVARLTNNSIAQSDGARESIILDGETYRTALTVSRSARQGLALSVTLPLVAHSPGFLDGPIMDWHDRWGLSNQRRDEFQDNQLEYAYTRDGIELVALRERQRGLGDVRIELDWELRPGTVSGRSLVLRSGIKLPTGSSEKLLGSGGTDLSLQVLSSDHRTLEDWNISLAWSAGMLHLGASDVLEPLRQDWVGIASAGLRWRITPRFEAGLQIDTHTAFYDSGLRALGKGSVQLSTGFGLRLGNGSLFELAMMQNLRTDTTPDFGVYIGWRSSP